MNPSATQHDPVKVNDLVVSTHRIFTRTLTLLSGQNVERGELLGRVTASGKLKAALEASEDGSEDAMAIAAEDVHADGSDASILVYLAGDFDQRKVKFGTGLTAANTVVDLAKGGIFLHPSVLGEG
ncbi:MAG: head decoration protein [Glycocaulis sp.]